MHGETLAGEGLFMLGDARDTEEVQGENRLVLVVQSPSFFVLLLHLSLFLLL